MRTRVNYRTIVQGEPRRLSSGLLYFILVIIDEEKKKKMLISIHWCGPLPVAADEKKKKTACCPSRTALVLLRFFFFFAPQFISLLHVFFFFFYIFSPAQRTRRSIDCVPIVMSNTRARAHTQYIIVKVNNQFAGLHIPGVFRVRKKNQIIVIVVNVLYYGILVMIKRAAMEYASILCRGDLIAKIQ